MCSVAYGVRFGAGVHQKRWLRRATSLSEPAQKPMVDARTTYLASIKHLPNASPKPHQHLGCETSIGPVIFQQEPDA